MATEASSVLKQVSENQCNRVIIRASIISERLLPSTRASPSKCSANRLWPTCGEAGRAHLYGSLCTMQQQPPLGGTVTFIG